MAEQELGMPRGALGVILLVLLTIAILAYVSPDVLEPMFLGILLFSILAIYALVQFLVSRGLVPSEYMYLIPVTVLGFAFLLAGLAQKGYLPMVALTGNAIFDTISTSLLYVIIGVAVVGVLVYLFCRPAPRK
ncbi:MAG: hypothetical protein DRO40_11120 [Thermoprotei archaeon]|nr:MAG: hypothetical protein DRO40_11120 [Thermoprotei archaeon]